MNTKNIIIISAAFALAACSNQNEPNGELLDAPVAAEFSAEIGEPISRAHDTSWDDGDAIGISGRFISGGKSEVTHSNVKYTVSSTSTGIFEPATTGKGIFFQNTLPVTFSAYYPFDEAIGSANESISKTTLSQSSSKEFDFLF